MNKTLITILIVAYIIFGTCLMSDKKQNNLALKPYEDLHFMRNYPDYIIEPGIYVERLNEVVEQEKKNALKKSEPQPNWSIQGPYNIAGRINSVAHNPGNDQIIYVGSVCGGIYKTIDGGENWKPIFDDQAYLAIAHIIVSPHDTNTLYVGTGDPNISSYPWVGNGIYKSTDAGETWQNIGLNNTGIVTKIAVHPENDSIIYAATMGLPFLRDENRGLYKTIDAGSNWEKVLYLSNDAGIIDMVMTPESPDTIIVAGWNRIRNYAESIASGPQSKLYRTYDGGENWDTIITGLEGVDISRIGLCLSVQDSIEIIAQFIENSIFETYGIYKSSDFGDQWQQVEATNTDNILGHFGWYFGKIRVNPYNSKQYFVLGVDLHRSEDNGRNFEQATPPWNTYEVHADKHDLVFIDSSTMLLATDGGLYKSMDNGHTWIDIENIPTTQFYRVTVDPFHNGFYCGGAQDNGTSHGNINDSANWKRIFGGDGFQPLFDWQDSNIMYAETQRGKIWSRVIEGNDTIWSEFSESITDGRRSWDMPICMSPINSKVMYTGTHRVLKNSNAPYGNWEPISMDLTNGTNSTYHVITAIDVSPFDDNLIMVGTGDGMVHYGDNFSFEDVSYDLPKRYVTDVFMSRNKLENVFVSHSGYKANEYIPHIHFSTDLGKNWQDISGNLPQIAVNSMYALYGYGDSVIFAATDGGVYHTLDQGVFWERTGANMPVLPVYDLAYDDSNHVLVAGTFARSIMTIELSTIVKKKEKETIIDTVDFVHESLVKTELFPNPASTYFKLKTENKLSNAFIAINDLQGKVLIKKELEHGDNWQINIIDFKKGIYLVSIIQNNEVISRQKLSIE